MECNTPESLFEISISRILLSTRQLEVPPWCLCTLLGTTVRLCECHRGWSYCLPSFPVFFILVEVSFQMCFILFFLMLGFKAL